MENTTIKHFDERRKDTIRWLEDKFPRAFTTTPRPLKIGIHDDIFTHLIGTDAPSKKTMRRTLNCYVNSLVYLSMMNLGEERVDLQGNDAGKVSEREAFIAKEALFKKSTKNKGERKKDISKPQERNDGTAKKIEEKKVKVEHPFGKILTLKKNINKTQSTG